MNNRWIVQSASIILAILVASQALGQQKQIPVPPIETGLANMPGPDALPARPELPDPLVTSAGQRVTTAAQWQTRREEMKRILSYYAVGLMPPAPGNVKGQELATASLLDGKVSYRLVHLSFGPEQRLGFDVAIFTPTDCPGPLPTIIFPSFGLTPGATPLPCMPRRPEQGKGLDALTLPLGVPEIKDGQQNPAAPDPAKAAEEYAPIFKRGCALVTYHYQDCGEDTIARNPGGSWAFRNTRFFPAYPRHDWGLLGAWAWGICRCIDYLEGQPSVDTSRLIAVGHSRIGKAVLVAGAFDERIAISAPAGSAGGGVGAYRLAGKQRTGGEGLDDMMRKYPNWFSPHLHAFSPDPNRLPFDQHWFIALTAPRGFIALEGTDDTKICSPAAVKASLAGTAPVYSLLGRPDGLTSNYCNHGHALNDCDWTALMDLADKHAKTNAIYIKSRPGRGGVIENVTCRNLEVKTCDGAFLRINLLQSGKQDPEPVPGFQGIPVARNLSFANVRLQQCGGLVEATLISPERPMEGLSLVQISGQASKGMALAHIRDIRLNQIQVTGYAGPLLQTRDVTGTGIEAAVPLN